MTTTILINGQPSDGRIPVTDSSVVRGGTVFEVAMAYGGVPFRLDDHLDRLEASARKLGVGLPRRSLLVEWMTQARRRSATAPFVWWRPGARASRASPVSRW